ncbi:lipocalin family protein [Kangiella sp. TOML190]|uniref:lipocalin family protein n=1 Tax=Kangiella sp. TOML190 TaxID=2931351 RepID=UPI00203D167C|nr:lipocalin family protein [Kangiella sp. TOML190]
MSLNTGSNCRSKNSYLNQFRWFLPLLLCSFLLSACSNLPPIRTEAQVDLNRFMGDWYVIANIPTFIEKGAHNAVESYQLDDEGNILTQFQFNQDGFNGKIKTYNPKGFVWDKTSNAVWGMQFIWPIEMEYRIVYLNQDYSQTIIGRSDRDYVWIMARTPQISEQTYRKLVSIVRDQGYDTSQLVKVPQQPLSIRKNNKSH